jgi:hypothetical protein
VSAVASSERRKLARGLPGRGMAGKPLATFPIVAVVSLLPAGSFTGHFRQGTAVPGSLFSEFSRSLAGACTVEQGGGDGVILPQ